MADQLLFTPVRVFDDNGDPGAGYLVTFYQSGTTTPKTVFTNASLTTAIAQPIEADAEGTFPQVFVSGGATKAVITDADGVTVATVDPVLKSSASTSAAAEISFLPTVDLPYTDVQSAIEGAAASAASGFDAFGLGVTGSGVLLADIDATNIAAGQYRFDNTTAGTFPAVVTKADGGTVIMSRESSSAGWQMLFPALQNRAFVRRMASSAWAGWYETAILPEGAGTGSVIYKTASNWASLAIGTATHVLRVNSGATAPEWAAPTGGYVTVATQTITSDAAEIVVTGLSGYKHIRAWLLAEILEAGTTLTLQARATAGTWRTIGSWGGAGNTTGTHIALAHIHNFNNADSTGIRIISIEEGSTASDLDLSDAEILISNGGSGSNRAYSHRAEVWDELKFVTTGLFEGDDTDARSRVIVEGY